MLVSTIYSQGILKKATSSVNKSTKKAADELLKTISSNNNGSSLTNEDINNGLKEALTIGTQNSAKKLGTVDGFFQDATIKILMPEEAKEVASTLRKMGMESLVDKAILSMNRAAEDAASGIGDIFINAVKKRQLLMD